MICSSHQGLGGATRFTVLKIEDVNKVRNILFLKYMAIKLVAKPEYLGITLKARNDPRPHQRQASDLTIVPILLFTPTLFCLAADSDGLHVFQYVEVVQVQLGETSQGQTVDCNTSRGRGFLVFLRRFDSFHLPAFVRSFIQGVQRFTWIRVSA